MEKENARRDETFNYLANGPFCLVALDSETLRPIKVNGTFEKLVGPLFKFQGYEFASAASNDLGHREKMAKAIDAVVNESSSSASEKRIVRNIEILTLAGDAGLPIRKHFDWTIWKGPDGSVMLFGDPCTTQDMEQRAKDAELIDFFQNAPIALHWLSGDGIVLWANKTEMDVLGYTEEEYIGKPIMNFCPDEEELVLEIFKQLGSGNAIRDVPVRFRTKDGRIVHLLIDSNVKYDRQGNFAHTRCFIRDDTGRKIREARSSLMLEETKRSLKMLDNFMSRSLHHMRTPMQIFQTTCELVLSNFDQDPNCIGQAENKTLLENAKSHISNAVSMINDISDLSKLDQGADYVVKMSPVEIKALGLGILENIISTADREVEIMLKLHGDGPAAILSDAATLKRVLKSLLTNSIEATKAGCVTLEIGYNDRGRLTFSVVDTGPGLNSEEKEDERADGKLPPIFQRYHQEVIPEEIPDFDEASSLRQRIEDGVSSTKKNGVGIGLSLSYHLVRALGGDLRYSSRPGMTKFWFSLPFVAASGMDMIQHASFSRAQIHQLTAVEDKAPLTPKAAIVDAPKPSERFNRTEEKSEEPVAKSSIASQGLRATDAPSVLIVDDTAMCVRLLSRMVTKMNFSATTAANGQEAVEILRNSMPGMFSLVLMDLRMPVMDGLEATTIIKHELKLDIPVVAVSGEGGEDVRKECDVIGFDDFCPKPMKLKTLKEVVSKFVIAK